jgi:hypothetical protein
MVWGLPTGKPKKNKPRITAKFAKSLPKRNAAAFSF